MQHLLGDSGPAPDSVFVRQLFLQRLPPSVHMVLASLSADLSLQQLAQMADRILEVSHVPTVAPVTDPNVSEMHCERREHCESSERCKHCERCEH